MVAGILDNCIIAILHGLSLGNVIESSFMVTHLSGYDGSKSIVTRYKPS